MLDRIRQRLTYANVVATLALFVALGGSFALLFVVLPSWSFRWVILGLGVV